MKKRLNRILGGLSCAIACRREGLNVTILEQSKQMSEVSTSMLLLNRLADRFTRLEQESNYHQTPYA